MTTALRSQSGGTVIFGLAGRVGSLDGRVGGKSPDHQSVLKKHPTRWDTASWAFVEKYHTLLAANPTTGGPGVVRLTGCVVPATGLAV